MSHNNSTHNETYEEHIFIFECYFFLTTSCSKLLNDNLNFGIECDGEPHLTALEHTPLSVRATYKSKIVSCTTFFWYLFSSLLHISFNSLFNFWVWLVFRHAVYLLKSFDSFWMLKCLFFLRQIVNFRFSSLYIIVITINSIPKKSYIEWIQLLLNIHRP